MSEQPQLNMTSRLPKRRVVIAWDMHYSCNFRCPYCWYTTSGWTELAWKNNYKTPQEWAAVWERMHSLYGRCQLRITAGARPATFIVHMSLVRSGRADSAASGTVHLSLAGSTDGSARSLDLASLSGGRVRELRYDFRYLQNFDQELSVPLAFKPEQLVVEVQSSRHDVAPLSQTFLWTIEASP